MSAAPARHPATGGAVAAISGHSRTVPRGGRLANAGGKDLFFVRIWLQSKQRFIVCAIDADRLVVARASAGTYRKATDAMLEHLQT